MAATARDSEMAEDRARSKGQADLREVKRSFKSAKEAFAETVIDAIEAFKARSDDFVSQRAQIIQRLHCEYPRIADDLNQSYEIPDHSNGLHVLRGISFSYYPRHEVGRNPVCVSPQPDLPPDDKDAGEAAMLNKGQPVPSECPLSERRPSPSLEPPTTIPIRSKKASAGPGSRTRPARLRPLKTIKGPIKTSEVANYWIFEHRAQGAYHGYYVLRCPSEDCANPVFSKNPLCDGRAKQHLRQCGHPFRSVENMIVRYARPVITGRKKREVTEKWARKHNSNLLASDEQHLGRENFKK